MSTQTLGRLEPRSLLEAAAQMREAAVTRSRLVFTGGGTHRAPDLAAVDAILSTRALRRVVEYAPEDQTVTVEAGLTLDALAQELAAHGQRLVVEVAEPERATIGGAILMNAFGPRRMCYGSIKDLILGVTLVRADGVPVRAGGKVVKNVAGFDLSKLIVGSYGTLALLTSATLRVHPLPEATRALRAAGMAAADVWALVLAIRARQIEPGGILALRNGEGDPYEVHVLIEGFRAGVDAKVDALRTLIAEHPWQLDEISPDTVRDADAAIRRSGALRARCTTLPADFALTDEAVISPLLGTLAGSAAVAYPALGVAFIAGTPNDATSAQAALAASRREAERRSGSLVVEAMPSDAGGLPLRFDWWGTPPPSFSLMAALKARFDPHGRLSPGTFVGGM